MAGHTPGPWEWDGDELRGADGAYVIRETDNNACGDPDCCGSIVEYFEYPNPTDKPLIAAAPALFEALNWLRSWFDDNPADGSPPPAWMMSAARAAIDSALGEAHPKP